MKTFLGAPLRHQNQKLGNLYLTEKDGGAEFTPEDESLLALFAAQAASAIHNSLLFQREHTALARAEAAQQALAESETRLRAILDNSTAVITSRMPMGAIS